VIASPGKTAKMLLKLLQPYQNVAQGNEEVLGIDFNGFI
jgi:hypothetical protein